MQDSNILKIILDQDFCLLKTEMKIVRFPIEFLLDSFSSFSHSKRGNLFSELTLFTGFSFVVRKAPENDNETAHGILISFLVCVPTH